jgi:hypothetical protein
MAPANGGITRARMIVAVDVVALWGLCAYGSRENVTA